LSRDTYDGTLDSPASQNHYAYTHSNPVNYTDPSGHILLGGLANIGLRAVSFGTRTVSLAFKTGGNSKRSFIKILACEVGVSYAKLEYYKDAKFGKLQGHHPFNTSFGANPNQKLLFLPSNTHAMYHMILHYLIKMEPNLPNTGNWTSKQKWKERTSPQERKVLYSLIRKSSIIVDRVCKIPYSRSLTKFVRMNKKEFLGQ